MIAWLRRKVMAALPGVKRDPRSDFWYGPITPIAAAGIYVTPERALQVPAVRACLKVLAETVAALPLMVFQRRADGGKERADRHPLFDVLHTRPNARQTAFEFRGELQWALGAFGNAYAEIQPGPRGAIDQLVPIHPSLVANVEQREGRVWYDIRDRDSGRRRELRDDEIWHLKGLPLADDGLTGRPPIETGREAIGAAIALQDYAARYFANDGQAGGILEHPGHFKDAEQRREFLSAWKTARTGSNAHRDAVLEFGMKYNRHAVNNEQAQFLETRKELAYEIARIWRIPPHKLGLLDRATFSNIEQQAIEFVVDTMLPILVLWEQAINTSLIIASQRFFAEFNVSGLLRGDTLTRYQAYAQARQWGWLSINDIRRLENMSPIGEAGDRYLEPMNMRPAGAPLEPPPPSRPSQFEQSALGLWLPKPNGHLNGNVRDA